MNIFPTKDFKVAKIVDEYSVVINAGKNFNILPGDVFEIYSPGPEIRDPDTSESLGHLDFVKAKISAKDVFPKMTVCQNEYYMSSIVAGFAAAMVGKPAELNVAAEDISGGFDGFDSKIRVGDFVRKIESCKDSADDNPSDSSLPSID